MFKDETSIGYNAALISQSGADEHGVFFPVYFKAFGEYKNPIYIYTVALFFKLFGVSDFWLRAASFGFYLLALAATFILVSKLFGKNRLLQVYVLLTFGLLPFFFTVSRIAFEVISQLAFIAVAVLLIWIVFNEDQTRRPSFFKIAACGLVSGISVYTYSTARLLSPLMLLSLWVVFFKKENLRKLLVISGVFLVTMLPLIGFAINNPDALTARFESISYLTSDATLLHKAATFVSNLWQYWSPDFLIRTGDSDLRHATGAGGMICISTYFLFLVGVAAILINRSLIRNRFNLFLLVNLLLAPVAAAATNEGTPHALRSLLLGYYIVLVSCFGLKFLSEIGQRTQRLVLVIGVFAYLFIEIAAYQVDYFILYPARSVPAMGSYGFQDLLQEAVNKKPAEVVFFDPPSDFYATYKYSLLTVRNPQNVPIVMDDRVAQAPGTCFIYRPENESKLLSTSIPFDEFTAQYSPNRIERLLRVGAPNSLFKARCYKAPG